MNERLARLFRTGFIAIAVLVAVAVVLAWFGWRRELQPSVESVTLDQKEYHLGEPVRATISLKLPWRLRAGNDVRLQLPPDLDKIGEVENHLGAMGFGWRRSRVVVTLQAYGFGPFGKLPWTLQLHGGDSPPTLQGDIPEITVKPRLDDRSQAKLEVAAALPESYLRKHQPWPVWVWWTIVISVVVISSFIAWIAWRMAHQEIFVPEPPKPWVVAADELTALGDQLDVLEPDAFFTALTDIIRRYLEAAYRLPATESTTPEFLAAINQPDGPLTADHRLLLGDFMTAADMIKFARGEATTEQLREALGKARQFVVESSAELMRPPAEATRSTPPPPEESDATSAPSA